MRLVVLTSDALRLPRLTDEGVGAQAGPLANRGPGPALHTVVTVALTDAISDAAIIFAIRLRGQRGCAQALPPCQVSAPGAASRRSCQARLWLCLLISSLRTYPALGRRMPQSEFPKGLSQSQLLEPLLPMQDKCLKDMDSLLCTSRLNAIQ